MRFNNTEEWYEALQKKGRTTTELERVFFLVEFREFVSRDESQYITALLQCAAEAMRKSPDMIYQDYKKIINEGISRCIHYLTKEKRYFAFVNGTLEEVSPLYFNSIHAESESEAEEFLSYLYGTTSDPRRSPSEKG